MRFGTEADVEKYMTEYEQKMGIKTPVCGFSDGPEYKPDEGPENSLQKKITQHCKEHGYPYL